MVLEDIVKGIGAATVIIGALYALINRGILPALRLSKKAVSFMQRASKAVDQLLPNGGDSVLDKITRFEKQLNLISHMTLLNSSRWRASHEEDPRGMFDLDENGHLIWANRTYLRLSGLDMEGARHMGWISAIAAEERAKAAESFIDAVEQQRQWKEAVTINGSGTPYRSVVVVTPLLGADGKMLGMQGIVTWMPKDGR